MNRLQASFFQASSTGFRTGLPIGLRQSASELASGQFIGLFFPRKKLGQFTGLRPVESASASELACRWIAPFTFFNTEFLDPRKGLEGFLCPGINILGNIYNIDAPFGTSDRGLLTFE